MWKYLFKEGEKEEKKCRNFHTIEIVQIPQFLFKLMESSFCTVCAGKDKHKEKISKHAMRCWIDQNNN